MRDERKLDNNEVKLLETKCRAQNNVEGRKYVQ